MRYPFPEPDPTLVTPIDVSSMLFDVPVLYSTVLASKVVNADDPVA
jgi:hypothetical protein